MWSNGMYILFTNRHGIYIPGPFSTPVGDYIYIEINEIRKNKHGILLGYDLEMSLSTTLSTSKCHYMNIIKWIDIIFSVIAYIQ